MAKNPNIMEIMTSDSPEIKCFQGFVSQLSIFKAFPGFQGPLAARSGLPADTEKLSK